MSKGRWRYSGAHLCNLWPCLPALSLQLFLLYGPSEPLWALWSPAGVWIENPKEGQMFRAQWPWLLTKASQSQPRGRFSVYTHPRTGGDASREALPQRTLALTTPRDVITTYPAAWLKVKRRMRCESTKLDYIAAMSVKCLPASPETKHASRSRAIPPLDYTLERSECTKVTLTELCSEQPQPASTPTVHRQNA